MPCRWRIGRSQWGLSLFYDGALVASANHALPLIELAAMMTTTNAARAAMN